MKPIYKCTFVKVLLIFVFCFLISIPAYSLIAVNGAGGGTGGGDKTTEANLVENLVTQGAVYYLQSASHIQAILNRVEQQAFKATDYPELRQLADEALDQVTAARQTYEVLLKTAAETPPNPAFILALKSFDYPTFMKENGLIEPVFKKVEEYLSRGDVPGLLASVYVELKRIEGYLLIIKKEVSLDCLPELPVFWKLNETCAAASLMGSYSTRVFFAVR